MNTQIETFKQSLYNDINSSQLPVGVVKIIIQNILSDINILYNQQLQRQAQASNPQPQTEETQDQF